MTEALVGRLMAGSIAVLLIAVLIIAMKSALKRHLSPRAQYQLWFPLLFLLAVPFAPLRLGARRSMFRWIAPLKTAAGNAISRELAGSGPSAAAGGWLRDFSESVNGQAPAEFYRILLAVWGIGVIFMASVTVISGLRIRRIRRASLPLQNQEVRRLLDSCRQELDIRREIPVLSTAYLNTPAAVGVLRPCILLPIEMIGTLPASELRFILLHELLHCKHRDTLVNQLACLAQILYWFHPAVLAAVKRLRRDGEAACDSAVLSALEERDYIPYGRTLIRFAAKVSGIAYTSAAGIGGSAGDLRRRILGIRTFHRETRRDRLKGAAVLGLTAALACCAVPPISASGGAGDFYAFAADNAADTDLSAYFQGYKGSFVLYDTGADQFSIYNRQAARTRISPDSTYKIYSALTALQAGVITPESNTQTWDQTPNPFESWNRDHTLSTAMKDSVNWYFNSLDRQSGADTLQGTLDALCYGNQDMSGGIGKYWVESTLKISPLEQVALLTRFEAETLPFDQGNIRAVKDALHLWDAGGISLYGKTGTGTVDHQDVNGWFLGYVKSPSNTWVFAVNIQGADGANGTEAGRIAMEILSEHYHIIHSGK